MTVEEFAAAVEALIKAARAHGLSDETLLIEIEDIASLLREAIHDVVRLLPPPKRRR